MTSGVIKVGDFVILNEMEAPQGNLVAVVVGRNAGGLWACQYLHRKHEDWRLIRGMSPTKVSDFGVSVRIDGFQYYVQDDGRNSVAKYHDGKHRQWQGPRDEGPMPLCDEALRRLPATHDEKPEAGE